MQLPVAAILPSAKITRVGNVGAGEQTLLSIMLPPGIMKNDGDVLRVTAAVQYAANVNNKTTKLYIGANTVAGRGAAPDNGASLFIQGVGVRTNAVEAQLTGLLTTTLGNLNTTHRDSVAALWNDPVEIRLTGEGVANNDIVSRLLKVEYLPVGSNYIS